MAALLSSSPLSQRRLMWRQPLGMLMSQPDGAATQSSHSGTSCVERETAFDAMSSPQFSSVCVHETAAWSSRWAA